MIQRRSALVVTRFLGALAALGLGLALVARLTPLPVAWSSPLRSAQPALVRVLDRDGNELSRVRSPGPAFLPLRIAEVDPLLIRATLAAEDRRFYRHPGLDPIAIARAARQNLRSGRRVSGGSTLTQQVVKLLRNQGRPPIARSLGVKMIEAFWALALEAHCSKSEILERYLNLANYGSDVRGAGAAAELYFGHAADRLTVDEAALLAALPRDPVRIDPRRDREMARRARDRVLSRLDLSSAELSAAQERPIILASSAEFALGTKAPHWIVHALRRHPDAAELRLPIDPSIQQVAQAALRRTLGELSARGADAGAIVVLHNPSGEVRAWIGSPDWSDPSHGQFDAAYARRQPGSTLKPFTYALAFEAGLRPATVLPDLPLEYEGADGAFRPRNYSGVYHGPVRARLALANSWNAPAVAVLSRLGTAQLLDRLRAAGLASLDRPPDDYGLGLTLGDGEVTLMELTTAYACLGRDGLVCHRVEILSALDAEGRTLQPVGSAGAGGSERIFDRLAVSFVRSILSDPRARARAFGEEGALGLPASVAIKTGTSSDWRDNWAFGFTSEWTAGVWLGQAEGAPMDRVSGTGGASRALRELFLFLQERRGEADREAPQLTAGLERRAICALSGEAPSAACPEAIEEWFAETDPPLPRCRWHRIIPIDLATGRVAGRDTPRERVRPALFTIPPEETGRLFGWPAEGYAAWGRDDGWPDPPRDREDQNVRAEQAMGSEPATTSSRPSGPAPDVAVPPLPRVRILRPADGAIYALDPSLPAEQQEILLVGSNPGGRLRWFVDGREIGSSLTGEGLTWRLAEGRHIIRATSAGTGRGDQDQGEGRTDPPAHEVIIHVEPASRSEVRVSAPVGQVLIAPVSLLC